MSEELTVWTQENIPDNVARALFVFNIALPNKNKLQVDVRSNLAIDYDQLEDDLVKTPQHYVWWGAVHSEAKEMVNTIERSIKARRREIAALVVKEAGINKVKLAEKTISTIVDGDKVLIELEGQLARALKDAGKLYYMVKAMEMKSEHLRSLSGFKRQERETQR